MTSFKPLPTVLITSALLAGSAGAQEGNLAPVDSGDTAWMLTSTVLVLLMTLPGLALFYGGLVRAKNVLSILMQCFVMAAVMSLLWIAFGYSLAAEVEGNRFIGDFSKVMLGHMDADSVSGTIPESVWVTFQMTFIIITPALMVGAFAERMRFSAVLIFSVIWTVLSYLPLWHMAWGGGLFDQWGTIDFAGGTVVHINAGIAGLVACIMLGKRVGYPTQPILPHSVPFTVVGASLLWVGWFGFNAGSAAAADGRAGFAMLTTQAAAAAAVLAWLVLESVVSGKPTAVGAATGLVAGLVAITPASGSTTVSGAVVIGIASSVVCYLCATRLKQALGYDDSLDVFGVHGVGGIIGALLTGVFLREGASDLAVGGQVVAQAKSVAVTIVWSGVAAFIGLFVAKVTVGLRVDEASEQRGLDQTSHGEAAYHLLE
ncbi:ammonium transporter [soil metagenome]